MKHAAMKIISANMRNPSHQALNHPGSLGVISGTRESNVCAVGMCGHCTIKLVN